MKDPNNPCLFCNVKESGYAYENDLAYASYDSYPVSNHHCLIIPKRHINDYFDLTKKFGGNLSKAFEKSNTKFFIISFTSDWLYPTSENREIVIALNAIGKDVGFVEITSDKGHDSFLLDVPDFLNPVKNFLNKSYEKI